MQYKQLTYKERYQIWYLKTIKVKENIIAKILGRHVSTIYRELKRNNNEQGRYDSQIAHQCAIARRENNGTRAVRIGNNAWLEVKHHLQEQWSPEQISQFVPVSHESIYQYVYRDKRQGGELYQNLRRKRTKRRRRCREKRTYRGRIINAVRIDKRPKIVDTRKRFGDFEVDTIISADRKQALVSIVERQTGLAFIQRVTQKTAYQVKEAIINLLSPIKPLIKTITSDNGSEFAMHESIAKALNCKYYFAHPYSSWERGSNENLNGLIRQYFPKKTSFDTITKEQIYRVTDRLNNRPRKRLNYKTPYEAFYRHHSHLAFEFRGKFTS